MTLAAKVYLGSTLLSAGGGGASVVDAFPTRVPDGVNTSDSSYDADKTITASATPHTKGAWTELEASLSADVSWMLLRLTSATNATSTASPALLDIGVGAAASEVVKVADIPVGYYTTSAVGGNFLLPVAIPSGSRVAARCQSAIISKAFTVNANYADLGNLTTGPADTLVTMGTNSGTSLGVSLSVPGSLNTKGAWTEIEASTSDDFEALIVGVQANGDASMQNSAQLVDVAVGAASSEQVIISNLPILANASEFLNQFAQPWTFGVSIPAGSRLSARYQRAGSGDELDLTLIGVPTA